MMKPPCIPAVCLHWLLTECRCQYRVDLKRKAKGDNSAPPHVWENAFLKTHTQKRSESLITLPDLKISVVLTLPAPSPGVKMHNIIGHGITLH